VRVEYLHSDIDALERVEILRRLRTGDFDVLVGVNLLREGLDLPEVALVAILDADKEGFLRSETSLIQTSGRAARHEQGRVLLYADVLTNSLRRAMEISRYRRERQMEYNKIHGITPRGIHRGEQASLRLAAPAEPDPVSVHEAGGDREVAAVLAELEDEMLAAAGKLEFERAAILRDQIEMLKARRAGQPAPARKAGRPSTNYRKKSAGRSATKAPAG
jgi:excinuclease ABC subunit B